MASIAKDQAERGKIISAQNARSITDPLDEIEFAWIVRFKLPFSSAASKNSVFGMGSKGNQRVFIRKESRNYRDAITLLTREAMRGVELKHTKLWIDIFVEKRQHKGDAINVIDLVCDAVKDAIPLDDRWYSIRRLDWSINKKDPHLFIGLAQEVGATDCRACCCCGQIRPLAEFTNNRENKLGKGHICIACRAPSYPKGSNKKYRGTPLSPAIILPEEQDF